MSKVSNVKDLNNESFEKLKESFGYKNKMQAPRLVKVVVSVGTGSQKDKKKAELIVDRLQKITGQKPIARGAKKAIANFKTRIGDIIGFQITMRGGRMYSFLDKFLNVSLPRTKDFRGLDRKAVDDIGNITIGIKEHTIFPETTDEDIKDVFGLAITIVSTAKTKKEGEAFFSLVGVPFRK